MPAKYIEVELGKLQFDPENPRLPQSMHHAEEQAVMEHLLLEEGLLDLMGSIAEQGFFDGEPLLTVEAPPRSGSYLVVEGNRRLAALKLLASDEPSAVFTKQVQSLRNEAKHKPDRAKILVFSAKSEILDYLGYRHITGIKEWSSLQKARYLRLLSQRHGQSTGKLLFRDLAKEIGSRADYVAKLLTGLTLIDLARDRGILLRNKLEEDDLPFSILTTAIGYNGICEHIGLSSSGDVAADNIKLAEFSEFFEWCFVKSNGKTLLRESRNLEKLARVLAHPRALAEIRRGADLESADLYTSGPLETLRSLILSIENHLSEAQRNIPSVEAVEESDVGQVIRVSRAAKALESSIKAIYENEDDNA